MRDEMPREEKMSENILVIENTPHIRKELVFILAEAGFTIAAVPDFPAALSRLREFRADMVILDTVLPDMDGTDAFQKIRTRPDISVVLLGENDDESWERAVRAKVNLYEPKPINYRVLAARVKSLFHRYQAGQYWNKNRLMDTLESDLPFERENQSAGQAGEG